MQAWVKRSLSTSEFPCLAHGSCCCPFEAKTNNMDSLLQSLSCRLGCIRNLSNSEFPRFVHGSRCCPLMGRAPAASKTWKLGGEHAAWEGDHEHVSTSTQGAPSVHGVVVAFKGTQHEPRAKHGNSEGSMQRGKEAKRLSQPLQTAFRLPIQFVHKWKLRGEQRWLGVFRRTLD